jgi:hypothetical protein
VAAIYAAIAAIQLGEMRKSTEAATRSGNIAACALRENQRQFGITSATNEQQFRDTLTQMRVQATASQTAANAAKSSAETASKQLELLDRPWISVAFAPESPITFDNEQMRLNLGVHLKNVGHAVATNVVIAYEPFLTDDPFHKVLSRQKTLCDKTKKDTIGMNSGRLEITLFPSAEDRSLFIGPDISMRKIMSNLVDTHNPSFHDKVFGPVYLVGCVDYQYTASPIHHQTQFAYEIGRIRTNPPAKIPGLIIVGEDVPVGEVVIAPWIFGGDRAY